MIREYKTERLTLRILDKSHKKIVNDYYVRNRKFLEQWVPKRDDGFYCLSYQKYFLKNDFKRVENGSTLRLWIFKKGSGNIIGTIGFTNIIRGAFLSCFMGYSLDSEEINNGYMTEAIEAGIKIIFDEYKLHRIEANIMPKNEASLKVVRKLGFVNEGISKKYLEINGIWEDHIHMVILNNLVENRG